MVNKRVSFSKAVETRTIDEIDRQSEESRSDEELRQSNKTNFNKFQLLNLVDGAETIERQELDNTDESVRSDEEGGHNRADGRSKQHAPRQSSTKSSKKPRKGKNKKGKDKKGFKDNCGTENDTRLVNSNVDIDTPRQADQMYREYNAHIKLLKVDTRNLFPENEMKKMWGKSVVHSDRSRSRGNVGQRSRFVNLHFTESRQHSSTIPKMELDDFLNEVHKIKQQDQSENENQPQALDTKKNKAKTKSNVPLFDSNSPVYFRFVHDKEYQEAQKEFVRAVHSAHPEAIVHYLPLYPNHAESLLQLSHIMRLAEDYKEASEWIGRTLMAFERGFHNRFNLATAQSRLSYRRPENRTFFIALFEHIISCHRRGLRKTPLDNSKLLLSLEPENDPLFATQLIDFFAIRSEEYDFVIEFYNSWWQVQRLPNMNFSLAMAYFLKSISNKQSKDDSDRLMQLADEQLRKSLLLFPNFILLLLETCSAEPSSELKKCAYFDYSPYGNKYKTVPETLDVCVELYVKRSYGLWKQKQTMVWLERNVASLVEKFATNGLKDEEKRMSEHWAQFKHPAPKNLLRHIALCPDLKIKMPASAATATFLAVDPFPPTDAIITYHNGLHQTAQQSQTTTGATGLASLFLRSFLPSFSLSSDQSNAVRGASSHGSDGSTTPSSRIDSDREIALGELVANEFDEVNQSVDLSAVHNSIRELTNSMSNMMNFIPLIGEQRENLANAMRDARSRDSNSATSDRRNQERDGEQQPERPEGGDY